MELAVISSLVLPLLGPRLQHFLSAAGMPGLLFEGCNTCFLGLLWGPRGFFAQLLPQSSEPQGSSSGRPVRGRLKAQLLLPSRLLPGSPVCLLLFGIWPCYNYNL